MSSAGLVFAPSAAVASIGELVLQSDFPDPSLLLEPNGEYFAYATQTFHKASFRSPKSEMVNIQVARSPNGKQWTLLADALPVKPRWASHTQNFWAPEVVRNQGRYLLYFAAQLDQRTPDADMCIGVAISHFPEGPFRDSGRPLLCAPGFEAIDPLAYRDPRTGMNLLYWGSGFGPIRVRELDDSGLAFRPRTAVHDVLHPDSKSRGYTKLIEGASVVERGGFYYLLVSGDSCCTPAHYAVLVARSKSPFGPFLYENERNPRPIIEADARWLAPGHTGLLKDEQGDLWVYYHAVDRRDPFTTVRIPGMQALKRVMLRSRISFQNGWPIALPSFTARPRSDDRRSFRK